MSATPCEAPGAVPAVVELGRADYLAVWRQMRDYTEARGRHGADQLWLVEHPPVFTLGQAGRPEHVLDPGDIPLVHSDRGGQVTYHGPGQAVMYVLLDLPRRGLGVKALVALLEQAVIDLLAARGVVAERQAGAPGVYVAGAKVAALGLRVRRGCSYHGVALNVDLDLAPYARINPCGHAGQAVTRLADLGIGWDVAAAGRRLAEAFIVRLAGRDAAA